MYFLNLHLNHGFIWDKEGMRDHTAEDGRVAPTGWTIVDEHDYWVKRLAQTSAYMAKNRLNSALKAETLQNMYLEAITENFEKIGDVHFGQTIASES